VVIELIDDAFAEPLRREPDHERRWVVVLDGNRDPIERVELPVGPS
jgi:hypothetical protein